MDGWDEAVKIGKEASNMKPFDPEAARAGKQVVDLHFSPHRNVRFTGGILRNGHLVLERDDGVYYCRPQKGVAMAPETHEKWIIIFPRDFDLYDTEESAKKMLGSSGKSVVAKVTWEA